MGLLFDFDDVLQLVKDTGEISLDDYLKAAKSVSFEQLETIEFGIKFWSFLAFCCISLLALFLIYCVRSGKSYKEHIIAFFGQFKRPVPLLLVLFCFFTLMAYSEYKVYKTVQWKVNDESIVAKVFKKGRGANVEEAIVKYRMDENQILAKQLIAGQCLSMGKESELVSERYWVECLGKREAEFIWRNESKIIESEEREALRKRLFITLKDYLELNEKMQKRGGQSE